MSAPKLKSIVSNRRGLVNGSDPSNQDTHAGDGKNLPSNGQGNGNGQPTRDHVDAPATECDVFADPDDWLDEERTQALQAVEGKDTEDAQKDSARKLAARNSREISEFGAEQTALGGEDHINAIRKTGWCSWERIFGHGSLATVLGDAGLWFLCGARMLVNVSAILLAAIALGLALGGRILGRYFSAIHLIDPASAKHTVEGHITTIRRVFISACILLIFIVIPLLIPGKWALFFVTVATILLIAVNVHLALLAGIAASLADILSRPRRFDQIDYEIDQRLRLRKALKKYLCVAVTALALGSSGDRAAEAGSACGLYVDEKITLDVADRERAVSFAIDSIFDQIRASGCSWVVAGAFGTEGRFTGRTWLPVPPDPPQPDCDAVEPEPLTGHDAIFGKVKTVYDERKDKVVQDCKSGQSAQIKELLAARDAFIQKLRNALTVSPRARPTPVRDFVLYAVRSGLHKNLTIVTDTLEDPGASLDGLALPSAAGVTIIVVRPNPTYAPMWQVLARAREWASVPGVRVVTTGELRPGIWADPRAR